jgi:transcriptional regulator GlxA family with amidase domain
MFTKDALVRLCRARDMLRDVHDRTVTIDEVARLAEMSPFHFIRQFSGLFGDTPHQARIKARLDRARNLLVSGDRSVTEICMEVGFSSHGSFSALFARRLGVPPSEYRRRARSMVAVPGAAAVHLFPGCLSLMGPAFAIFEKQQRSRSVRLDACESS